MNYTQTLKTELVSLQSTNRNFCCNLAFFSAAIRGCGSLVLKGKEKELSLTSASLPLIGYLQRLTSELFPSCYTVINGNTQKAKAKEILELVLFSADDVLQKCHILQSGQDGELSFTGGIAPQILANECCCKSYLRGLLAASGAVKLPFAQQSGGYHLQMSLSNFATAEATVQLLANMNITAKITQREDNSVVYIKDSEIISDFLAYLGASGAVLTIQSLIVEKGFNNDLNRKVNMQTHNLDKSLTASAKHIKLIETCKLQGKLENLPQKLKQLCQARAEHQTATMDELAAMLNTTKSAINHRFRKLAEIVGDTTQ